MAESAGVKLNSLVTALHIHTKCGEDGGHAIDIRELRHVRDVNGSSQSRAAVISTKAEFWHHSPAARRARHDPLQMRRENLLQLAWQLSLELNIILARVLTV